jgi:hypothetical protein
MLRIAILIHCSNSSLLECSPPIEKAGFDSQPRYVSLGTSSLWWRWTLVKSLHISDLGVICLAWQWVPTCKCLMSIFSVEQIASAIRPTSKCSSCVFLYVPVTTCTGRHVADSYLDVPSRYYYAVRIALCWGCSSSKSEARVKFQAYTCQSRDL